MNNISLTFTGADDGAADPALVGAIAREAVTSLRAAGFSVEPAYTGARGGILFEIVAQLAQCLHESQPFLTEVVKLITPIVAALLAARPKPAAVPQPRSIIVVVQIDRARIHVPADKAADDTWLLEQLLLADPTLATTTGPGSHIAVEVEVAPSPRSLK